jgi:hypothetical protein
MGTRRTSWPIAALVAIVGLLPGSVPAAAGSPITAKATGEGVYQLLGTLPASFRFNAIAFDDGRAAGSLAHSVIFQGQLVEFTGRVTCVTVDSANDRAWVGGVITSNTSQHPSFLQSRHQVGHDIWFRVVDYGEGSQSPADRTTFVGFEGDAGFPTSAAYCAGQPWPQPPPDDRTWAVTEGSVQVHD